MAINDSGGLFVTTDVIVARFRNKAVRTGDEAYNRVADHLEQLRRLRASAVRAA